MNAKASLIKHLLAGEVLNIKNCFTMIGITNCPREISRAIEKPFNVVVSRTHRTGKTRYGNACCWTDYRLNQTEYNAEGIKKMTEYLLMHDKNAFNPGAKTEKQMRSNNKSEKKLLPINQQSIF